MTGMLKRHFCSCGRPVERYFRPEDASHVYLCIGCDHSEMNCACATLKSPYKAPIVRLTLRIDRELKRLRRKEHAAGMNGDATFVFMAQIHLLEKLKRAAKSP